MSNENNIANLKPLTLNNFAKIEPLKADSLLDHAIDPFKLKRAFVSSKKAPKKNQQAKATPIKEITRLPQIKIIGESIRNHAKQYTISYNGEILFKSINEEFDGLKLIRSNKDSLVVLYRNELFTVPIGN
jgi:hypothetical protein